VTTAALQSAGVANPNHEILEEYLAWLEARRYTRGTIRNWIRMARRVLRTFPNGVPADQYAVATAVIPGTLLSSTQRTAVYRFCEFLALQREGL